MNKDKKIKKQLESIMEKSMISAVYQPIVSLRNGEITGYEALSRIQLENCDFSVEEMFEYAEQFNHLWMLEYICRKKAIKGARKDIGNRKLFLNVDPNIIRDERFKEGMTKSYLDRYGISPDNIVFEISERTNIEKVEPFQNTIAHYKKQNYQIAIDDFGKGYAQINRIFFLQPQFVKLDISLVKNIDKDSVKSSLIEGFIRFCHDYQITVIAEGIETKQELKKLIQLGVDLGQGYLLGRPNAKMRDLPASIAEMIQRENSELKHPDTIPSFFGTIGTICQKPATTTCDTRALSLFEYMQKNPQTTEICVVDENNHVCGLLTKQYMDECFGGRYGYSLHSKNTVMEMLNSDYLEVDIRMPIEMVAKLAMIRPRQMLYDAIIVSDNGTYVGIVTVKDLLNASVTIQLERAIDQNPLTHLPGNQQIQKKINNYLLTNTPFSIMYLDLDNFKAYNDAYGFENGDLMLKAVAGCIQKACRNKEFIGHIGGDDFVVTSDSYNLEEVFADIIDSFHLCLRDLYTPEDYSQKTIHSHNRHGEPEDFPLVSISGALLTNEKMSVPSWEEFSYWIAKTKKKSKDHPGDYLQKYEELSGLNQ